MVANPKTLLIANAAAVTALPAETDRRFLFDRNSFHLLAEANVFAPDTKVELIEGEIIIMSPIGKKHAARTNRTVRVFSRLKDSEGMLSVQNPLLVDDNSEPIPDVMILTPRDDFYEYELPQPKDILLIIEISDSTLSFDRRVKLPLYARNKIRETWLVNLVDFVIEIYTEPKNGTYTVCRIAQRGEKISPLAFPKLKISVDAILG